MNKKENKKAFTLPQAERYMQALLPRLEEKRFHSFTTIVFSLFTFSFFSIFAIAPTLTTITDLKKQISDNQFVNQQLQQKITNLSSLQTQYKKIQPNISVVEDAIPSHPEVTQLVGQLQSVVQLSGVTLSNIQTLPVDITNNAPSTFNSFTFTIDVVGSYSQLQTFIKTLTSFNRIVTIEDLAISKPLSQTDGYALSIRGKAYFLLNQ